MRRGEAPAFSEFIADEAKKYARDITMGEIETWFETFKKTTLEDFKLAWVQHKRDERNGRFFPNIPTLQRLLRITGEDNAQRDWRCAEEINGQRCGYAGSISSLGPYFCSAHFRLKNEGYTSAASQQIIDASVRYKPPKNDEDLYAWAAKKKAAYYGEQEKLKEKAAPGLPRASDEEIIAALHASGFPIQRPDQMPDDSHLFQEGAAP